ncbi:nucleotidyl transferase AbiEii/AbiGii toxin family protein [Bathymodiolus platifrons methanotrophic gill symbiont]|uniref:nucleotidyl transferase AbiEii/AbiGii toxin family protein n=1 Tax=Bathymodiolus platifrons methanotrophic gill symbiont TaxID=113268 RepID=UPI000B40BE69|nr:nucleotidyl transferase AbiEii/AbiGii toxin family protein [Bathymodiolus platifrons methanotrophic gill symbiont]TXL10407.1 hypothetical protein BMR08_09465 [Methylococcaceae bacterium CS2]
MPKTSFRKNSDSPLNNSKSLNAILQDNKPDEMRIIVDTIGRAQDSAQIKIEVSPVARGTLHKANTCDIIEKVEDEFGFASIQMVSLPDLYGGKLCAAMDRQHPRDLFDVKILLQSRGVDREIFIGYLAYLLSHNRPISEVMNPRWKNIGETFHKEFNGMTFEPITLEELQNVPTAMVQSLKSQFTQSDLDFLLSFKSGDPDWSLAPHEQIQYLPAVQWKLLNIQKMPTGKRQLALETLNKTMLSWLEG